MKLSLRTWFRTLRARRLASPAARRRTPKAYLNVEGLEERAVPAFFNLAPFTFSTPAGTFQATTESLTAGAFHGNFDDAKSGLDVKVGGNLQSVGKKLDVIDFHGVAHKGLETEQVVFTGHLHESTTSPLLEGTLTEKFISPTHDQISHTFVESNGHGTLPAFPHAVTLGPISHSTITDRVVTNSALTGNTGTITVNPGSLTFNPALLHDHIFVLDPVVAKYESLGGANGFLGAATTNILSTPDGVGEFQDYQNGVIYYAPFSGAHEIHGAILQKWDALGQTAFGYPTTDETTTPDTLGRFNHFALQNGAVAAIDWTPQTGAHEVHGAIAAQFASTGWEQDGEAVTDEIDLTATGGAYNRFEADAILGWLHYAIEWTAQTGAHVVNMPSYTDLQQGGAATCWIDASIAEVAYTDRYSNTDPSQPITYLGNNEYSVALYNRNDPSNPAAGYHPETQTVYFDGTTLGADPNWNAADPVSSWTIIEHRAIIQAVEEWDPSQSITSPHSGGAADALQILTGRLSQWVSAQDRNMQQEISAAVQAGQNVCLDTKGSGTQTLVAFHYYAVLSTTNQGITMYNPWGSTVTVAWSVINQDGNGFVIN